MPDFQHPWKRLPVDHSRELAQSADLCQGAVDASGVREERMAQLGVLDEKKYGKLLGRHRPRLIPSDEEFDRLAAELEALDRTQEQRDLDAEEQELQSLLAHLCREYEDRTVLPPASTPLAVLKFLMDQNGLRPVDMLDVFGSRAVASQVLNGSREISKAHARRLADRFHLSVAPFI